MKRVPFNCEVIMKHSSLVRISIALGILFTGWGSSLAQDADASLEAYFQEYLEFAENDPSIYRDLSLAAYYAYMGNTERALSYMELFSQQEKYPYWYILFMGFDDPLFESVNDLPEFQKIIRKIELKFWKYHKQIKDSLKEKGLL